jgi:hypothetical protein
MRYARACKKRHSVVWFLNKKQLSDIRCSLTRLSDKLLITILGNFGFSEVAEKSAK